MSLPLSAISVNAFSLGGGDFKGLFKMFSLGVDNDQVDGGGGADRYEYNLNVKQGQQFQFNVMTLNGSAVPDTNLDLSLWSLGADYLTALRSGSIAVTTKTKEGSSIAALNKVPVAVRTTVEVQSGLMVFARAAMTDILVGGTLSQMDLLAALTFGASSFAMPMTLKSGKITVRQEDVTIDEATLTGKGTPTSPDDSSLLGTILLGNGTMGLSFDTGGETFATSGDQVGIITRLNINFADGALIGAEGTLMIQGALSNAGD